MISDRPLHIVVYTDSEGVGGAEISLSHLVATASPQFRITVVGVSHTVVQTIAARRSEARQIVLSKQGINSFLSHYLTFQKLQPDLIHINLCTPWAGAIGLTTALLLSHVRVARVDQLPLRTTDTIELWRTRTLSLRVDAHVAVGEASARRMEDFYALGRNSVISIPNGVPDIATVHPLPNQQSGQMIVGSVGRLDSMKAHDVLLQAVAPLEGIQVVILGEGDQRQALEKLAAELNIADRVNLVGWVDDSRSYLSQFDVVAMPSRSEGFPLAVVEAMLAARPVIATRVGSMPEAVINNETGILIEKNDVAGLTKALLSLRDDPLQRMQLGKQAREMATQFFTVQSMTAKYEVLWQKLLQVPRKPRFQVPRPKD